MDWAQAASIFEAEDAHTAAKVREAERLHEARRQGMLIDPAAEMAVGRMRSAEVGRRKAEERRAAREAQA